MVRGASLKKPDQKYITNEELEEINRQAQEAVIAYDNKPITQKPPRHVISDYSVAK